MWHCPQAGDKQPLSRAGSALSGAEQKDRQTQEGGQLGNWVTYWGWACAGCVWGGWRSWAGPSPPEHADPTYLQNKESQPGGLASLSFISQFLAFWFSPGQSPGSWLPSQTDTILSGTSLPPGGGGGGDRGFRPEASLRLWEATPSPGACPPRWGFCFWVDLATEAQPSDPSFFLLPRPAC